MPFDFEEYARCCKETDDDVLQEEYERYVRQTARGSAGTAVGYGLAFFTFGVSLIGAAASAATLANAATKVNIIRTEMERRGKKHKLNTRVRDVYGGIALGSLGLVTTPVGHAMLHASSGATFYHGHANIPSHDYISRVER
jgi:hypothetical protein